MQKLRYIPYFGALGLLIYMPFHIFLSQWLSTYTGGLEAWKIGKDVSILLLAVFTICLVFWQGKADRSFNILLITFAIEAQISLFFETVSVTLSARIFRTSTRFSSFKRAITLINASRI